MGLSSLPHLKAVVRISTARDQVELVKQEIIDTVNGPMLGMLNQRGIGVQRVSLRSLGKVPPSPPSLLYLACGMLLTAT